MLSSIRYSLSFFFFFNDFSELSGLIIFAIWVWEGGRGSWGQCSSVGAPAIGLIMIVMMDDEYYEGSFLFFSFLCLVFLAMV